jgi:hypothetical protein
MPEKTTYFAIISEFSTREKPGGVLRRIENDEGERDEAFGRDLVWSHTSLLYSAERGNLDNKFVEISEEEAERIVARIRASVTGGLGPPSAEGARKLFVALLPGAEAFRASGFELRPRALAALSDVNVLTL